MPTPIVGRRLLGLFWGGCMFGLFWFVRFCLGGVWVVREHNQLGRQVRGGIAPLLARIHQGYRAHPDVQAWAAAQELEEALRMAICLGSVD